jgi:hypothetical protein
MPRRGPLLRAHGLPLRAPLPLGLRGTPLPPPPQPLLRPVLRALGVSLKMLLWLP